MDYQTLNQHRYTNTALDDQISPYDEGWADGVTGNQPHPTLKTELTYRQGYVRGLVKNMREIAARQQTYTDPLTGFDWF